MNAIIFDSNTGFTERYAKMLGEKTGLKVLNIRDKGSLPKGSEVIYLGWLNAGGVTGFKKARKYFNVKALCPVGLTPLDELPDKDVIKRYGLKDLPVFYLRGGFDMDKLKGLYKLLMKIMISMLEKNFKKSGNNDIYLKNRIDGMKNKVDFVSEENLEPLIDWYNQQ
ncbi:MAG: flavodoxin domain-containing protein [Bacillota bacterium]|nr:flavodoxin domain-containing protein [Bacillota bacterium]